MLSADKQYLVESRLLPLARKAGLPASAELRAEAQERRRPACDRRGRGHDHQRDLLLPRQDPVRSFPRQPSCRPDPARAARTSHPHLVGGLVDRAGALFARDVRSRRWAQRSPAGASRSSPPICRSEVLEKAKAGIYSQFEVQRGLPIQLLMKYFTQVGDIWQIAPDMRAMVQFRQLNLLQDFSHLGTFDVVFCRNVLIYFDQDTKAVIFERMAKGLDADGTCCSAPPNPSSASPTLSVRSPTGAGSTSSIRRAPAGRWAV